MITNLDEFAISLDKFQKENVEGTVRLAVKKLAFDCYAGVTKRSPVDTGRFRESWTLSIDEPDTSVVDQGSGGTAGEPLAPKTDLAGVQPFGQVYVNNQLPYAEALENGHSKQAPQGMVLVTLQDVAKNFEAGA